jgi:hypothetical protein
MLAPVRTDAQKKEAYRSPYSVKFTYPLKELIADIESGERGDPHRQASVPHAQWYVPTIRERFGAWGPPSKHYAAPANVLDKPIAWQRERAIAVALRFTGYGYQHHHIPDWDPPEGWPWKETSAGHNGKGVDCSNYTAFVLNLGFGLKPTGNVKNQSALKDVPGPGEGRTTPVKHIKLPDSYSQLLKTLRTGDLLFIRNREKELAHVVFWVGPIGNSPDGTPLILDSHGNRVKDTNGATIPAGIYLRPFRENSWYYQSASHALRIWQDP